MSESRIWINSTGKLVIASDRDGDSCVFQTFNERGFPTKCDWIRGRTPVTLDKGVIQLSEEPTRQVMEALHSVVKDIFSGELVI